jgi:hypothetical protein
MDLASQALPMRKTLALLQTPDQDPATQHQELTIVEPAVHGLL